MGNRKMYAKFQENLFGNIEIKSIFCPPLFRKRPINVYQFAYVLSLSILRVGCGM